MASLIACPIAGRAPRKNSPFAATRRWSVPDPDAGEDAWYDYVYLRDNPRGRLANIGSTHPAAAAGWWSSAIR
jgi:sarcosine oxidase delta subunit